MEGRLLLLSALGLGCAVDDTPSGPNARGLPAFQAALVVEDTQDSGDSGETSDTGDTADTAVEDGPAVSVDVLVIGAGAAGMVAALEAQSQGASVLLLEMAESPGGGAIYAANFLLVDTAAQRAAGYSDTVEAALADWSTLSPGGDASDPVVQEYLAQTSELVSWFEAELGAAVVGPYSSDGYETTPRIHNVMVGSDLTPGNALIERVQDITWTSHRADALVTDGERVVGAEFTDLRTGETGWVAAGATVIATGGFARNVDEVSAHRPELSGMSLLFEIHPAATGSGLPLLEQVAAATHNEGAVGMYAHAVEDPRGTMAGEAVWLTHLSDTLMVDEKGQRNFAETDVYGFLMAEHLLAASGQRIWALYPGEVWDAGYALIPAYNPGIGSKGNDRTLRMSEFEGLGGGARYRSVQEAATAQGIDADTLAQTIERYNFLATEGLDLDHDKPHRQMVPIEGEFVVVELKGGLAKCFTGVALDARGQVVNDAGQPIPGLYAAGEVAGMLGVAAVGSGFEGSISAVYWTGRRAGASAATDAERP